jgi:hypothetical protein
MASITFVTLVCTTAAVPYKENDIFTVEKSVADILLNKDYKGDLRVRKFDNIKDSELLATQRGKALDVVPLKDMQPK